MFCTQCGEKLVEGAKFCGKCGAAQKQHINTEEAVIRMDISEVKEKQPLITLGFSERISDPSINAYRQNQYKRRLIAGGIIGVLCLIGIVAMWYGEESKVTFEAIRVGLMVGAVPFALSVLSVIPLLMDKTYVGTIKKFKSKKHTHSRSDIDEDRHARTSYTYIMVVDKEGFGNKTLSFSTPKVKEYYEVGEKIKHHKGFLYPEKYDKNSKDKLLCINCFTMNDKEMDTCEQCGMLLMK